MIKVPAVNYTNDGCTSKRSEYDFVKKMSKFSMEFSDCTWQHQKYARPEFYESYELHITY